MSSDVRQATPHIYEKTEQEDIGFTGDAADVDFGSQMVRQNVPEELKEMKQSTRQVSFFKRSRHPFCLSSQILMKMRILQI